MTQAFFLQIIVVSFFFVIIVAFFVSARARYLDYQFNKLDTWYAYPTITPEPRFAKVFERYDNNIDSVGMATFRLIFFLRPRDRHQKQIDLRNKILSRANSS